MIETKETQRQDRNDFNTKLSQFKVDVSMMTFEKATFKFLKDKVYPGWNDLVSKSNAFDKNTEEIS